MLQNPTFRSHPTTLFSRERRKQRLDAFLDAFNRQIRPTIEGAVSAHGQPRPRRTTHADQTATAGK